MEINIKESEITKENPQEDKKKTSIAAKTSAEATGKRKSSVARVWLKEGKGKITVNKIDILKYFPRETHRILVQLPFVVTDTIQKYDITATAAGGGISGQADALKHGISKALLQANPIAYKASLKSAGLLTRDSRVVERKKPGKKKARKSPQFSKR
jgi:small subunit ribosomal protein S9